MARLEWDQTGERQYETGTDHAVLYPLLNGAYNNGVAWNGVTGFTESPGGAEAQDMYADNIKYASPRSSETYGSTIEAYTYPDAWAACDGSVEVVPGVTAGQQKRMPFGLSVRTKIGNDVDDDAGYKLHLQYNSTASPSDRAYSTVNDSPEGVTFSWETNATPVPVKTINPKTHEPLKPMASITIDSTKTDPAKLKALEDILYGTETKEARLPLPDEVFTILGSGNSTNEG
jgi:hypothetical protein